MKKDKGIWENNVFILKLIHKSSPGRIPLYFTIIILKVGTGFLFNVFLLRLVLNSMQTGRDFSEIIMYIIAVGTVLIVYYLLNNYYTELFVPISDRMIYKNIQKQVFRKAEQADLSCYENTQFYDTYIKAANETGRIAQTVLSSLGDLLHNILTIFSVSLIIFIIDPIFIVFTVIPLLYTLMFGKKLNRLRYDFNMEMTEKTRRRDYIKRAFYLSDYAKEMRLTNIGSVLFGRFYAVIGELKKTIRKHGLKIAFFDYWAIVIQYVLLYIGSIIYSAYRTVVLKNMLFGDCVIIVQNIVSTAASIQGVVNGFMQLHSNALSVGNIRAFLEYRPAIAEDAGGLEAPENCGLALHNVSFAYPDCRQAVLKDISISISPGEKIALVGHNGAGKTTLVKLLLRFYDPTDGTVLLNGTDIRKYRLSSFRLLFAAVFQKYRIFSMSVLENILLRGNITEEDRGKASAAMRDSGIYEKAVSLPKGMDTVLTKEFNADGAVLSGGEYQKIAVARIFARPCKIVILDEPSSALDPIAEYRMYEVMMKACAKKSVIYISHRLSSAVLADRVYMLENGEIVESGTHAQLLDRNGKYADMWRKQSEQYRKGAAADVQDA